MHNLYNKRVLQDKHVHWPLRTRHKSKMSKHLKISFDLPETIYTYITDIWDYS